MCACRRKGRHATPAIGGSPMSVPERPSSTYVPPPPPAKQSDVKRPPLATAPPAPPRMDVPSNGGNAFIPPPPAMKQANGKVPPTRIFDVPADQPMSDQPHASMQKPTDLGGGAAKAPVPFLATTPMIGLAQSPNPFAPYCGPDNELTPASALCRAAGEAGLSDYCRQQLLAFLASKSSQTLGSWIAAQELCDQAALRRAVGIAEASMAAKASSGLYGASGGMYSPHAFVVYGMPHGGTVYVDLRPVTGRWLDAGLTQWEVALPDANPHRVRVRSASGDVRESSVLDGSTLVFDQMSPPSTEGTTSIPNYPLHFAAKPAPQLDKPGFGNPFGVDGYAWKQDRVRKPAPFSYRGDGSTMDWRSPGVHGWLNPSGGMPNYHRASGGFTDDIAGFGADADMVFGIDEARGDADPPAGGTGTDAEREAKGRLTAAQTADAFARGRDNPPTNYAAIIGSASQAVGGIIAGINTAVQNGENNRLRELELTFNNTARSAELALRARQVELQGEIARIRASAPAAAADPATTALIQRLEQQGNEYRTAIQRQEAAAAEAAKGMGGGTIAAIVVGGVAVLGIGAYVLTSGKRR